MRVLVLSCALVASLIFSRSVLATETFIIGDGGSIGVASTGNGNFEANSGHPLSFDSVSNWHNIEGDDSAVNFGTNTGMGGSPEPGSQGAFLFGQMAGNDTPYTITAGDVGEPFNFSFALNRFGGGYDGDEAFNISLFESTTGVDANTVIGDITTLASTSIAVPTSGFWSSHSAPAFYTIDAADVGKTVYLGLDLDNPGGGDVFPRIDVVQLTKGVADPFQLQFNAALNPVNGTDRWEPNLDTSTGAVVQPSDYFTFASNTSANAVNDPSVPGITASYSAGGQGRNFWNGTANSDPPAFQGGFDASFEVWFKPDNLAGGDQIVLELGGSGNGSYFSLENDVLSFYSRSNNVDGPTLSTTLTEAEWTQVVGTWEGSTETLQLFVNGEFVTSAVATGDLNEWAGGNAWGLGQRGQSDNDPGNDIAVGGPLTETTGTDFTFAGEIAIFEIYDSVLSASEVQDAYDEIAAATVTGDADGDGDVDGTDFLMLQRNNAAGIPDWESNYGADNATASFNPVPEPSTALLLCVAVGFAAVTCRNS